MDDVGNGIEVAASTQDNGLLLLYEALIFRARRKLPLQPDAYNVLPPADVDFRPLFETKISQIEGPKLKGRRRDFRFQKEKLRNNYTGKPEILALHMLLISYLRRRTPYTKPAKQLFFRLWREEGEALLDILPKRDLVSALRTFADIDDNPTRRIRAKLGFVYATMIKIYESERVAEAQTPDIGNYTFPVKTPRLSIPSLHGVPFDNENSLQIVHMLLAEEVESDSIVGPMLLVLVGRIKNGHTVFSRVDRARVDTNLGSDSPIGWSFCAPPAQALKE